MFAIETTQLLKWSMSVSQKQTPYLLIKTFEKELVTKPSPTFKKRIDLKSIGITILYLPEKKILKKKRFEHSVEHVEKNSVWNFEVLGSHLDLYANSFWFYWHDNATYFFLYWFFREELEENFATLFAQIRSLCNVGILNFEL